MIVEMVKKAEVGQGDIGRLYESRRRQRGLTITFGLVGVWRKHLLEENQARLEVEDNCLQRSIRPFQILTQYLLPEHQTRRDRLG